MQDSFLAIAGVNLKLTSRPSCTVSDMSIQAKSLSTPFKGSAIPLTNQFVGFLAVFW